MAAAQVADVILYLHICYILAVILPVLLIPLGDRLGWRWVRNLWVRLVHLAMIGIVVAESFFKIRCPLTVWEQTLRAKDGQIENNGQFIAYWMHKLFFFSAEPWVFTAMYVAFGLVIVALWLMYPPRRTQRR